MNKYLSRNFKTYYIGSCINNRDESLTYLQDLNFPDIIFDNLIIGNLWTRKTLEEIMSFTFGMIRVTEFDFWNSSRN